MNTTELVINRQLLNSGLHQTLLDNIGVPSEDQLKLIKARDFLPSAVPFFLEENLNNLCNPYNTSNKIYLRKHPFENFFIGNNIDLQKGLRLKGILVFNLPFSNLTTEQIEVAQKDGYLGVEKIKESISDQYIVSYCATTDPRATEMLIGFFELYKKIDELTNYKRTRGSVELRKKLYKCSKNIELDIAIFIMNFLDFLNNPDVKVINTEHSDSAIRRRERNGRPVLRQYNVVTLTGEQKKYVNSLQGQSHTSLNHRFWVRGHFMTLKANRYGDNVGKKIWRHAFIKGQGTLIIKDYDVKKTEVLQ